ncbi:FtsW/RodA/SpoVE family cell cycle protein [Lyngbya confervoides]|uniref:FtsW/RodA/SpoVE family cell cycle protein n=1 Tax=Lyngbya confervoides TaxID=207921 RepID=UPI00140C4263
MKVLQFLPFFDPSVDKWAFEARFLQWLTGIWLILGLVVLYSASFTVAIAESGDGLYYLKRQILGTLIGLVVLRLLVRTPIHQLYRWSTLGFLACLLLIFAVRIPGIGVTVNGATRWISLGPVPLQPSEMMKPFLVLQSAYVFGKWHRLSSTERLKWLGLFGLVLAGILIQPNLSTTALCGVALWLIAFSAGLPLKSLGMTALGGVSVALLSVSFAEYQRRRIMSFLNPWVDPLQDGYQLIQSLLAVGSGGVIGNGYGLSQQKTYLPFQHTDFIFSVFADEFGLLGSLLLFGLLALFSLVALKIAIKSNGPTHRLIAMGALVFLVGQSLLHIGVTIGALPTTGLPFPLVSYGSNSLIASLTLAGLLIRVAREDQEADIIPLRSGGAGNRQRLRLLSAEQGDEQPSYQDKDSAAWRSWQERKALARQHPQVQQRVRRRRKRDKASQ